MHSLDKVDHFLVLSNSRHGSRPTCEVAMLVPKKDTTNGFHSRTKSTPIDDLKSTTLNCQTKGVSLRAATRILCLHPIRHQQTTGHKEAFTQHGKPHHNPREHKPIEPENTAEDMECEQRKQQTEGIINGRFAFQAVTAQRSKYHSHWARCASIAAPTSNQSRAIKPASTTRPPC